MHSFFETAPKAELHLHLRGAMPGDYFERLLQKYSALDVLDRAPAKHADLFRRCEHLQPFFAASAVPGDLAANLFRYRTFEEFLLSFLFTSYFFREIDDLRGLIAAVRHGLERQRIVYAEITVSVGEYVNQGLPLPEILTALDEAAKSPGVRVQWIVDLVRNFGPEATLRLLPNPWQKAADDFPEGKIVSATITNVLSYGAFANLDIGVEGLIHATEMPLQEGQSPRDILSEGQRIELRILHMDASRQRLGFSMILENE
jgi:hypothetical protein